MKIYHSLLSATKNIPPIEKIKLFLSDAFDIFPIAGIITVILLVLLKLFFNLMKYKKRNELKEKLAEVDGLLDEGMVKRAIQVAQSLFKESKISEDRWLYSYLKNDEGIYYFKLAQLYNRYHHLKKSKDSLEEAKRSFQKKLFHLFTYNRAILSQILINLASVNIEFSKIRNTKDNLRVSLNYLNQAKKIRGLHNYPDLKLSLNLFLAKTYLLLFEVENKSSHLKQALQAIDQSKQYLNSGHEELESEILFWEGRIYDYLNLLSPNSSIENSFNIYLKVLDKVDSRKHPELFIDLLFYSSAYSNDHIQNYDFDLHDILLDYNNLFSIYPFEKYPEKSADISLYKAKAFFCLNKTCYNKGFYENTINFFLQATQTYHIEAYPITYGLIQFYLGETILTSLMHLESSSENIESRQLDSIHYFKKALSILSLEKFPIIHSRILYKLGMVYELFSNTKNTHEYLEISLRYYNQSIKTIQAEKYPITFNYIQDGKECHAQLN